MEPFNAVVMQMFSTEALKYIPDKSLDFVYIDANHSFDYAMIDIIKWIEKVRTGGIISGHDYCWHPSWVKEGDNVIFNEGVRDAVNSYTDAHAISRVYITEPSKTSIHWESDKNSSWFFVV